MLTFTSFLEDLLCRFFFRPSLESSESRSCETKIYWSNFTIYQPLFITRTLWLIRQNSAKWNIGVQYSIWSGGPLVMWGLFLREAISVEWLHATTNIVWFSHIIWRQMTHDMHFVWFAMWEIHLTWKTIQNAFSRILDTSRHVNHAKCSAQSCRSWKPCEMD